MHQRRTFPCPPLPPPFGNALETQVYSVWARSRADNGGALAATVLVVLVGRRMSLAHSQAVRAQGNGAERWSVQVAPKIDRVADVIQARPTLPSFSTIFFERPSPAIECFCTHFRCLLARWSVRSARLGACLDTCRASESAHGMLTPVVKLRSGVVRSGASGAPIAAHLAAHQPCFPAVVASIPLSTLPQTILRSQAATENDPRLRGRRTDLWQQPIMQDRVGTLATQTGRTTEGS